MAVTWKKALGAALALAALVAAVDLLRHVGAAGDGAGGEPVAQADSGAGAAASPSGAAEPAAAGPAVRPIEPFAPPRAGKGARQVARASLAARIEQALAKPNLKKAKYGVAVRSVTHDKVLYERGADAALIVASNNKLMTTAAALATLGAEFEFETRLYARGSIGADGALHGDLVVRGDGDPDVRDEENLARPGLVERLADAARAAGLSRVTGALVVDDTCFDREYTSPEWKQNQLGQAYSAPVAGFSSLENCVTLQVSPGASSGAAARVLVVPESGVFQVQSSVRTGAPGSQHLIDVPAPVVPGRLVAKGTTPAKGTPEPITVAVAEPARTAGLRLKDALARAGIRVDGGLVLAESRLDEAAAGVSLLATARSPIGPALQKMNKESSNVVAEHLYKRCGFARAGKGTFASGGEAVLAALESLGIPRGSAASADGSGLARGNHFSAGQIAHVLDVLYRGPQREFVLETLAEGGVDGTLENRFKGDAYRGRVRGKTGYISGVSSLSGFAQADGGEVLAFSIVMNGYTGGSVKPIQDAIAELLVDLEPAAAASSP